MARRSDATRASIHRSPAVWALLAAMVTATVRGDEHGFEKLALFNWDLISLEQNNPRFNGSVLSGFHSMRSPGVTPYRGWKTGLGILYAREEQVSEVDSGDRFTRNQLIVNPKLNYGFYSRLEAGIGLAAAYTSGREIVSGAEGVTETDEEGLGVSSVDLGIKWSFLDLTRLRLGAAFDTRLAVNRGEFGLLSANLFNIELDGDFYFTSRFSVAGNLQFITSDSKRVDSQVVGDLGLLYSFSDQFRGMLFTTIQEDDEARTALGFVGIAGQYAFEQHSFTLAFDLLLNDADRALRSEEQFDVELSYTFTF